MGPDAESGGVFPGVRKDAGAKEHGGASTESAGCTDLTWGAGGQAGHREVQAGPGGTEGFPGNQDHQPLGLSRGGT